MTVLHEWGDRIDWGYIQGWGMKIGASLLILIATHFLAKIAQWGVTKAVDRIPFFNRDGGNAGENLGQQTGSLVYWLVWLVGLVAALRPLGLDQVAEPINQLTSNAFAFIPNLLGAGLILLFGLLLASVAKKAVETALSLVNLDGLLKRIQPEQAGFGGASIVKGAGVAVYVLIVIPVVTAALETLNLNSLSKPLTAILENVALFFPKLAAAALVFVIGYLIARHVGAWVSRLLDAMGLDGTMESSGLLPRGVVASKVGGTIAYIATFLATAIAAVDILQIPSLERMLEQLLALGGHVLFGTVIIVAGVLLARFLRGVVSRSGSDGLAPAIVHYAVIALATAMGLRFMGLANEIVNLAFGLILGSAAVACAIAFGWGGRETAHRLLERWTSRSDDT
ncbi:mechanosensitive ion channel [Pelagerythrobacter marensis]|nr:mechanosensitive ion channel [Pelagerythrobacter marensis]